MKFTPSFLCCGFQVVFARTSITNHLHGGLPDNKTMTAKTRAPINSSELSVVSCVVSRSHACIQNTNRIRAADECVGYFRGSVSYARSNNVKQCRRWLSYPQRQKFVIKCIERGQNRMKFVFLSGIQLVLTEKNSGILEKFTLYREFTDNLRKNQQSLNKIGPNQSIFIHRVNVNVFCFFGCGGRKDRSCPAPLWKLALCAGGTGGRKDRSCPAPLWELALCVGGTGGLKDRSGPATLWKLALCAGRTGGRKDRSCPATLW